MGGSKQTRLLSSSAFSSVSSLPAQFLYKNLMNKRLDKQQLDIYVLIKEINYLKLLNILLKIFAVEWNV